MNNIQTFQHNQFGQIRVATTETGEPLFCLADLCKALNLTNPAVVAQRLDDEERYKLDLGRDSQVVGNSIATFVTESGMYMVILRSDSPKAKPMQRWVTGEVLPAIRKHGGYLSPQKIEEVLFNPDTIIMLATQLKEEQVKRIEAQKQIELQAPAVTFTSAVVGSQNSCLIGELAKLISQNGVEIGEKRLFEWMRNNGYLGKHGERYNIPNQQYIEQGLFEIKRGTRSGSNGVMHITTTPKVTGKGQVYFVNKFLKNKAS